MTTIELKKNFHRLIDSIDNEGLLLRFYDLILKKKNLKDGSLWNNLSISEQEELILSDDESNDPDNLIDNQSMSKKHIKWLKR